MPLLSVVIPVYNEESTLADLLAAVVAAPLPGGLDLEVVVVDDHSTDATPEILSSLASDDRIRTFRQPHNRGKGAAMRRGFQEARGDIVLVQDADLEYDPSEYPRLLAPILDGRADAVYGTRFSGSEAHRVLFFWHMVGNRLITLLSNMATNLNMTDVMTCYKVFRRAAIDGLRLEQDGFGFDTEITAKVARRGIRMYEVGISYSGRTYEEGKKIRWTDGFRSLWCILNYGLLGR